MAAVSRAMLSSERRSLPGFFRATFLALFVGGITGGLIHGYSLAPETQGAIVGLCAFVADDILRALIALAGWFRDDPMRIVNVILNRRVDDKPEGGDGR